MLFYLCLLKKEKIVTKCLCLTAKNKEKFTIDRASYLSPFQITITNTVDWVHIEARHDKPSDT